MKVRMLVKLSGTRNGVDWPDAGNVIDLPEAEAVEMCKSTLAIPYHGVEGVETATESDMAVEMRQAPAVTEHPLTTKSGPRGRGGR